MMGEQSIEWTGTVGFVPSQSREDSLATTNRRLALTIVENRNRANLNPERKRGHIETIKHEIIATDQSGESILDCISQWDTAAAL